MKQRPFTRVSDWLIVAWLLMYLPAYSQTYGYWNFLQLCNVGVLLACIGWWLRSELLLSCQTLASTFMGGIWLIDAASKLAFGRYVHGGTGYMWDASLPLGTRLLSLYHLVLPVLLLLNAARNRYDIRAFRIQSAIAAVAMTISFVVAPARENVNYVFQWPNNRTLMGDAFWHACLTFLLLVCAYWPTHLLLSRLFARGEKAFLSNEIT